MVILFPYALMSVNIVIVVPLSVDVIPPTYFVPLGAYYFMRHMNCANSSLDATANVTKFKRMTL